MRETLLLAEDDPDQRWIFSKVLRAAGFDVLAASDGAEALAVAAAHAGPIELLVSDVRMPRVGGFELADRLRLERPGLKVLFVSGDSDAPPTGEPLLAKPFAHADLAATAWAMLGGQGPCEARAAVAWGGTAHLRPAGVPMTTRQTVMEATPGAEARFVQPEAHAAEAYLRQAHWEVYGPGLGAALLGLGFSEEAAWADAASGRMRREAGGRR
jgi:CheY-like chemotaxis protein